MAPRPCPISFQLASKMPMRTVAAITSAILVSAAGVTGALAGASVVELVGSSFLPRPPPLSEPAPPDNCCLASFALPPTAPLSVASTASGLLGVAWPGIRPQLASINPITTISVRTVCCILCSSCPFQLAIVMAVHCPTKPAKLRQVYRLIGLHPQVALRTTSARR